MHSGALAVLPMGLRELEHHGVYQEKRETERHRRLTLLAPDHYHAKFILIAVA